MFVNVGHNAYYILMGINIVSLSVVSLFWYETKGVRLEHMAHVFGEVDEVEMYKKETAAAQRVEGDQIEMEAR